MNLGTAQIIQGNALNLPLPDHSVDLICTSPPYFGLRSYQDAGAHCDGQIGSEATPAEFLDALIAATREMVRVLKPSGSIFVNLGDKYSTGNSGDRNNKINERYGHAGGKGIPHKSQVKSAPVAGMQPKSLLGIPWRYAIRCIDELGLILRAEIIWSKPNGLPESVTDRVRRSHEQWFHFVKQPRYFAAVDEIREAHLQPDRVRADVFGGKSSENGVRHAGASTYTGPTNSLGKLPGSVWTIPTQPLEVPPELGVDHFAAYPMEWPRRIIQGWTPQGICAECGEGRRPIVHRTTPAYRSNDSTDAADERQVSGSSALRVRVRGGGPVWNRLKAENPDTITGYRCDCYAHLEMGATSGTRPAVVLDPFMGTGTTLVVARALGRNSIGVDLSADYCRLAEWRVNNPQQLAAALQIEKPAIVPDDQLDLFEGLL